MEDIGRVDVLETTEGLVQEALEVGVGQRLAGADLIVSKIGRCDIQ